MFTEAASVNHERKDTRMLSRNGILRDCDSVIQFSLILQLTSITTLNASSLTGIVKLLTILSMIMKLNHYLGISRILLPVLTA